MIVAGPAVRSGLSVYTSCREYNAIAATIINVATPRLIQTAVPAAPSRFFTPKRSRTNVRIMAIGPRSDMMTLPKTGPISA